MNRNLIALKKACLNKNITFNTHHGSENLVSLNINEKIYPFINWTTPLNSHSISKLCQDKDYFYSFYKDVIMMPKTSSYLNPYIDERYNEYLKELTISQIVNEMDKAHNYPFIVKQNSGSWGTNVFKVNNFKELEKAILSIFNMNSASYDYICLGQDLINIKQEFRVIYLNGEYQFSYKKVIEDAQFVDNLSPLHWEGSKAVIVDDPEDIQKIKNFCLPMFDKMMIPFCGLDIALDINGDYWLIEANSAPGFDKIIIDEGDDIIIKLYENILDLIPSLSN